MPRTLRGASGTRLSGPECAFFLLSSSLLACAKRESFLVWASAFQGPAGDLATAAPRAVTGATGLGWPQVFQLLFLLGREDLGQALLDFLFQLGDLLGLLLGQLQCLTGERRHHVPQL